MERRSDSVHKRIVMATSTSTTAARRTASSSSTFAGVFRVLIPFLLVFLVILLGFRSRTPSWWVSSNFVSSASLNLTRIVTSSKVDNTFEAFGLNEETAAGGGDVVESNISITQFNDSSRVENKVTGNVKLEEAVPLPSKRRRRRDMRFESLENGLAKARLSIREASLKGNRTSTIVDPEYTPKGSIYRNAYAFHRSYLEMENLFKVHVYEEGEPPIFHDGPCQSIYSTEGNFIHSMEMETKLRTRDPEKAHMHFLPFSIVKMVMTIYERENHRKKPILNTIADYIEVIARKYPFWNRSRGADHFMLSCHDWGPQSSKANADLFFQSIHVLCDANTTEGFKPSKDVSLPEVNFPRDSWQMIYGGPPPSDRPILAFFAGGFHGPVRPLLMKYWEGRDNDVQVYGYLPKDVSYADKMLKSKFCLCPSGYETASPRIVEAIYADCVPVTINDHYVLPFSDVLDWSKFSIQVSLEDIPNIKKILTSVSPRRYARMQGRIRRLRRHFMVNSPPKRYDLYHMVLHSVWLRRLNVRIHPED